MATKYPNGRSFREACSAGDYNILEGSSGEPRGEFPGCGTIEESLAASVSTRMSQPGELVFSRIALPASSIGCMVLGDVTGPYRAPSFTEARRILGTPLAPRATELMHRRCSRHR